MTAGPGSPRTTASSFHARRAADRPDVPRGDRRPRALLDLQQPAGRRHHARAEQRAGGGPERAVPTAASAAPAPARACRREGGVAGATPAAAGWQAGWAGANPASRFPPPTTPTSSGPPATATRSRATTPGPASRARSPLDPHARLAARPDAKYRCHWTPPLAIDPVRSRDGLLRLPGDLQDDRRRPVLVVISPDLSTQDPARIVSSGGIIGDNLGQFDGEVVFAIAPSQIQRGLIWAGTNDGQIWYTPRRRRQLERRDEERPGMPPGGRSARSRRRTSTRRPPTSRSTTT